MSINRRNPWSSYRQVATQTAPPGQLVLMLFDGAIRFLEQARLGFDLSDPKTRNESINNNLLRAQAIITELNCSLNTAEGGKLADTLRQLYQYFDRRLVESNMRKEDSGVKEVIHRMSILRDAWAQMLTQTNPATEKCDGKSDFSAVG